MFTWVLQRLADAALVRGKTVGIEHDDPWRRLRRCGASSGGTPGEDDAAFLTRLAEAAGIATPTRAELARFDRPRKTKTANADWTHPHDPDARVTKMKDGRTHLAHKAEHAVDLESTRSWSVTVAGGRHGRHVHPGLLGADNGRQEDDDSQPH